MFEREGLHLVFHARPAMAGEQLSWHARELTEPLQVSFQQVTDRFTQKQRLFIEPDGSWVWVEQAEDGRSWQLDGQLHDGAMGLMTVEIKLQGDVPWSAWRYLLESLDWPRQPLLVQWCRAGLIHDVSATEASLYPLASGEVAT